MKRICFFTTHYDPARQVIMEYYERIFPKDVEIFVVSLNKIEKKYQLKRTKLIELLGNKFIAPIKLRKFCKENKIDLLVNLSGSSEVAIAMFFSTVFTKTKQVFYFMGNPKASKNWFFLFYQFFVDRIFACSLEVAEKFQKVLFLNKKRILYLPNPINVNLFSPKNKISTRKKLGLKKEDKILVYVGRVEYPQGSDYLLELVKRNPDKKFIFIGQVKDKNFKEGNFNNLQLIPFVLYKNIPDYYNAADLSLFFTRRNSYPFPPRESIACNTPVILFKGIGSFKVMRTPAVMKVSFDIEEIQKKIDDFFVLSEKEKSKIAKDGREFIVNDSSEEKVKEMTLSYFLDLLK